MTDTEQEQLASIVRVGDGMGVVVHGEYILTVAHNFFASAGEQIRGWGSPNPLVPVSAWSEPMSNPPAALGQVIAYEPMADIAVLQDPGYRPGGPDIDDLVSGIEAVFRHRRPARIRFDPLPYKYESADGRRMLPTLTLDPPVTVHVLNCKGVWLELELHRAFSGRGLLRGGAVAQMDYGTSGSPVWDDAGYVVGLTVSGGPDATHDGEICVVSRALPVWLAEKLRAGQPAKGEGQNKDSEKREGMTWPV